MAKEILGTKRSGLAEFGRESSITMRHTFISIAYLRGLNIKWLAEYCGTSVAMIEKHYGALH
jgi:hypothetical protein